MGDRQALLEMLHSHPRLDAPRLVYADWLDEFGTSDLDAATSEFIRLTCDLRGKPLMPKAAFPWISKNWQRLVPTALAMFKTGPFWRTGRQISFSVKVADASRAGSTGYRVNLRFLRGFCEHVEYWSSWVTDFVKAVRVDQPHTRY